MGRPRNEAPGGGPAEPDRPEHDIAVPPDVYVVGSIGGVAQSPRHYDVTAPTQAGDTLLIIVSTNNANAGVTGVTDSKGNRYTLDGTSNITPTTWVYRCEGRVGGPVAGQPTAALTLADRVSVTCNAGTQMGVGVMGVHIPRLGPCDQRIFNAGATETGWTQTRTPTGPGQFCINLAAHQANGADASYDPPFQKLTQQNATQLLSCAYLLEAGPAGQVVTLRAVLSGTGVNWRSQLWTFDPELLITTEALPAATEGRAYPATTLEAAGGRPAVAWALAAGVLPAGLALTGAGVLSGNLAAGIAASYPVTFRATDAAGTAVTRAYTIVVRPAVRVVTGELPSGFVGAPYEGGELEADGGLGPYTWAAEGLPAGLAVAGAAITGTPEEGGDFDAQVTVTDAEGGTATAALPLFIDAKPPLVITTGALPDGAIFLPYDVTLTAEGGAPSYEWEAGPLPAGLAVLGDAITGVPTEAGDFEPTVKVTDQDGDSTQRTYPLSIAPQSALEIITTDLPRGIPGVPYLAPLEAAGGAWPYLWSVTGLPEGLGLADAIWPTLGVDIVGTPAEVGGYDVAATVTDAEGNTAEAEYLLTIAEPPEAPEAPVIPVRLVPVVWAGLDLNPGDRADGATLVVEDVAGWYGSPPLHGHDLDRALTDGAVFGAKVTGARVVTLTGKAAGPRAALVALARDLAARAVARQPAPLSIAEEEDPDVPLLTAMVRAGEDQLDCEWRGRSLLAWQVALTAADPRLYEERWREAVLAFALEEDTGRDYPYEPPRSYAVTALPNNARLANPGNVSAPVSITYTGPLDETRLTDGPRTIRVGPLADRQEVLVDSLSLVALAPGGATRASYILAGSQPMAVPARATVQWRLHGTGRGTVTLRWRGAWT